MSEVSTPIDETDFVCLATIRKSGTHYTHHFLVNYLLRIQGLDPGETLFSHDAYRVFPNIRYKYLNKGWEYKDPGPLPSGIRDLVMQHGFGDLEGFPGKVIALYRNPLDSVLSLYHYSHGSRKDEKHHVGSLAEVAETYASRWAISYIALNKLIASETPVLAFRYEDLVSDPIDKFRQMVRFIGADLDEELLLRTVEDVQGDRFRKVAADKNLNPGFAVPIARDGSIGQWRSEMTDADIALIAAAFARRRLDLAEVMKAFPEAA